MKVSVLIITYNHEKFIAQAIESALMQETDFQYEIVIGEDCSTDKTREIVKNYAQKYPDRIRTLLHPRNLGFLGKHNFIATFQASHGQYIALLEGDDYWTEPRKLQMQVDFLDSHPQYSMCCTDFSVVNVEGQILSCSGWWGSKALEITHLEIIQSTPPKTLTTLIRRNTLPDEFPEVFSKVVNGDGFLFALASRHGSAAFLDTITGCYRRHADGIWSVRNQASQAETVLESYTLMKQYFTDDLEQKAIEVRVYGLLQQLLTIYLIHFEFNKLSKVIQNLFKFPPKQIIFAWMYVVKQLFIYTLKASFGKQYLRFLQPKRR